MAQYIRAADKIESGFRVGNPRYINRTAMIEDIANMLQSWHGSISTAGSKREELLYTLSDAICKILLIVDGAWYDDDLQPLDSELVEFLHRIYNEFDGVTDQE